MKGKTMSTDEISIRAKKNRQADRNCVQPNGCTSFMAALMGQLYSVVALSPHIFCCYPLKLKVGRCWMEKESAVIRS